MALDIARIREFRPNNELHYFTSVESTMKEAARFAEQGSPHGTVVIAEEQTAGMGRLGRTWISEPEVGIYCSVLLQLKLPPGKLPVVSLLLGLATAEAIHKAANLSCDLRWPNDVLIDGCKVAGILTHLVDTYIVAGIGINVNNISLEPELRTPATSLLLASGKPIARETLLVKLLESLDRFCEMLVQEGPGAVVGAFTLASSYVTDRRVSVEENGVQGTTTGLDEDGFLLIRTDHGLLQRVAAGGIRPA